MLVSDQVIMDQQKEKSLAGKILNLSVTVHFEFKQLKKEYPDRILIASIMEEYDRYAGQELLERVEETRVDAFEINFSCPHGMPERKMGVAVGKYCALLGEVCGWVNEKATIPVWEKMPPNVIDIIEPRRVALSAGSEGLAAINTIMSVMGINLNTLQPEPCVEGYSTRVDILQNLCIQLLLQKECLLHI